MRRGGDDEDSDEEERLLESESSSLSEEDNAEEGRGPYTYIAVSGRYYIVSIWSMLFAIYFYFCIYTHH